MGAILEIPEWLFATIFSVATLAALFAAATPNTNRQIRRTLAKRPNPSKDEFIELMSLDVSREASDFIWESAQPCLELFRTKLTLHPDDHLLEDLPIDEEEWSIDWPREWSEQMGFHQSNFPSWPDDRPATVRNLGRWFDMGPPVERHPGL